jgi:electron transport complex protein RnfB
MKQPAAVSNAWSLVDRLDDLLPQTQCRRCGYAGCRPYAEALAAGEADINRCPPGGAQTINALAYLLERKPKPLDPECGTVEPGIVAVIDEDECIGCTKCIQACPVDAILGAAKHMHTVIEAECTGCELCIEPCPVDCIDMRSGAGGPWGRAKANHARARYRARNQRLERLTRERETERRDRQRRLITSGRADAVDQRKAEIAAIVERVRRKRAQREAQQQIETRGAKP